MFADYYRQLGEADMPFAKQCMAHWRRFLMGPPNKPNEDVYGLLDVRIDSFQSIFVFIIILDFTKKFFRLYSSFFPVWLFINFSVSSYLSVFSSVFPYVYHSVCQFSFLFSFLPSFLPSPLYQLLFFPIHSLNLSHSPKLLPTPHFPSFPYFF